MPLIDPNDYNTLVPPKPPERPVVHAGEVAASLFNDLGLAFRRIQAADAFEARVMAAAKSPRDWLLLRDELNPTKAVVVGEEPTP